MVSSFRLTGEEEKLLALLSRRTGKSRSELVRLAIEQYGKGIIANGERSSLQRLVEAGFKPISLGGPKDLASSKDRQRKIIIEKLKKGSC